MEGWLEVCLWTDEPADDGGEEDVEFFRPSSLPMIEVDETVRRDSQYPHWAAAFPEIVDDLQSFTGALIRP